MAAITRRRSKQFCLSLYGVPGSWCAQGLFEPSEYLWQEWGLILKVNSLSNRLAGASPLPLDLGYLLTAARAPHSRHSSAFCLAEVSLTLDAGYPVTATPAKFSRSS